MNPIALVAIVAVLGFAQAELLAADGATAPYNEAVTIVNGKRVVEVAPFPQHMNSFVANFKRPNETTIGRSVFVVETSDGLMDCRGTPWYHPKACSPSTFGEEKRDRTWMVKRSGAWFGCISQAQPIRCVPLIVDGKLRPLPSSVE